nr:DUF3536 domain-containing protein [[Phormidium] sp. ETS-05]
MDGVTLDTASALDLATTAAPASKHEAIAPADAASPNPIMTASGVYVTVHGHFYQPPRENPYLDAIERQPSASPFHDWNERIHHECYRPNAFARVMNDSGELVGLVNNYEYLSFNIGPTLMTWLERYDMEVYKQILEADRKSAARLNGHGNAIAQVYNHIIMPLANERDKYTQIRWGKYDFRSRFGRDPEGIWLAETAVDVATLKALVAEGFKFTILAPSQAERCRPIPTEGDPEPQWHAVGGGQIDPTRPYRCFLPADTATGERQYIDIFFYDGPISRDMGFNDVLLNSGHLAGRLGLAIQGDGRPSQLLAVATDGETFGHHKGGTEKCLAYAFTKEFPRRGWTVTNFAHYLSINTPTWEVELKPVTAWSCSHGVNRWQDDCGCGGGGGWHQQWRRPLRNSLNWLRDKLTDVYATEGSRFLRDPWLARDEYIQVLRDRSPANVETFLARHQNHILTPAEQVDALRLLEMQRHTLLMFTSCGWFFEEISRPEGVQILRYAARAIELAGDVAGVQLETEFVAQLEKAPSNVGFFGDGAAVYRHMVVTAQITLEQVVAHYAISGLFTTYAPVQQVYCYEVHQRDYQLQRMGPLTLAVGQVQLVSQITLENVDLMFAVLHLGGWDFHCCIQPFAGRRAYTQMKQQVFAVLPEGSAARTILAINDNFDGQFYSLRDLFAEERHRIMRLLSTETLMRLDQLYTQVYRDNYGVMMGFHRDELSVPKELQVAAEIALSHRCLMAVKALDTEIGEQTGADGGWGGLLELEAIAHEATHLRCQLDIPEAKKTLEHLVIRILWHLLHDANPESAEPDLQRLERILDAANLLNLNLALDRAQELYFHWVQGDLGDQCFRTQNSEISETVPAVNVTTAKFCWSSYQLRRILALGKKLAVDVTVWSDAIGEALSS